jgi:hypothetical protein
MKTGASARRRDSLSNSLSGARAPSAKPFQVAKQNQTKPNKSKEIQAIFLGFPWIPLVESGLFKGLQRIQIKELSSGLRLRARLCNRTCSPFSYELPKSMRRTDSSDRKDV